MNSGDAQDIRITGPRKRHTIWLPLLLFAVAATVTVLIWMQWQHEQRRAVRRSAEVSLHAITGEISNAFQTQVSQLRRMVNRWASRGGTPADEWRADADGYLDTIPYLRSMHWIAPDGTVQWSQLGAGVGNTPHVPPQAFERVRERRQAQMTSYIEPDTDTLRLLLLKPLTVAGQFDGAIMVEIDAPAMFERLLAGKTLLTDYDLAIEYDGRVLFNTTADAPPDDDMWTQRREMNLQGIAVNVTLRPSVAGLAAVRTTVPMIMLAAGLLLSALAAMILFLGQTSRLRAAMLERALVELNETKTALDRRVAERTEELSRSRKAALNIAQDAEEARRRAEQARIDVDTQAERLRAIVDNAVDGIITIDKRGIIQTINPAVERMFGYTADEAVGANVNRLMPQPYHDEHDGYLRRYLETGEQHIIGIGREVEGRRKDGSVFPIHLSVSRMTIEGEIHFTGVLHDITQQRRAQEQLKRINAELEARSQEMEQFVYTVSHDLKSPIVTCVGFMGFLREDLEAGRYEKLGQSIDRLDRAIGRMKESIDDLLELSRIGRVKHDPQQIDVAAVLEQLKQDLAPRLEEACCTIEIQNDLPPVYADAKRIYELFENLLTNAVKYGCDGDDARITVGASRADGEIRYVIADNGPGIAPKYHDRVFQLFHRLDQSKDGTGVGLAIVRRIMEIHGGRVWIVSEAGQGAAFWIAFPDSPLSFNGGEHEHHAD